jgi:hypothetical protein
MKGDPGQDGLPRELIILKVWNMVEREKQKTVLDSRDIWKLYIYQPTYYGRGKGRRKKGKVEETGEDWNEDEEEEQNGKDQRKRITGNR